LYKGLAIIGVCFLGLMVLMAGDLDWLFEKRGFPESVNHSSGSAVNSAEDFIRTRFDLLNETVRALSDYVAALNQGQLPPHQVFEMGYRVHLEEDRSTQEIVRDFSASAAGAYLTDQDEEFLKRLIRELERDANARFRQAGEAYVGVPDESGFAVEGEDAVKLFMGAAAARRVISSLSGSDYLEIARAVRAQMIGDGNEALWKALAAQDQAYLRHYEDDQKMPSLNYYVTDAIREVARSSRKYGDQYSVSFFAAEWLLKQSYLATPSGYVYMVLETTGVNDFLGDRELARISRLAVQSLRDASDRAPPDLSAGGPAEGRPRVAAAKRDLEVLSMALEIYRLDNANYPSGGQGLAALVQRPDDLQDPSSYNAEGYIKNLPADPWGYPYIYESTPTGYELKSLGADGQEGGEGENADIEWRHIR
jgi:type II secretion system protein G